MAVNAIDLSDLTKKPKPQGFQTPPPHPPQTQLGIKNAKPGKVEPAMGYPVNQMGQGDELLQLFPIPVMICPYPNDYSKELECINFELFNGPLIFFFTRFIAGCFVISPAIIGLVSIFFFSKKFTS